ncbi:MAG: PD40 domain-containing protein [Planctomycetes bacterium]|nr:PD40 domain-containing protein [Planctomycetota bacterium]
MLTSLRPLASTSIALLGVAWLVGCGPVRTSEPTSRPSAMAEHDHSGHGTPSTSTPPASQPAPTPPVAHDPDPREKHFRNLRQLTFGGENAEAYWSADGERLIFQSTRPPYDCDQIFTMNADGTDVRLVSTGEGRTTCAYFFYPDDRRILFSSTHETDASCPERPDYSRGYVWPIYSSYDIYTANVDGTDLRKLTNSGTYDAEATMAVDGSRIVFTSMRDGDLDVYTMNTDGTDVRRITTTPGYDGGAFFSFDGKKIVYRAAHPEGEALEDYRMLLAEGLIRPTELDLYVVDADGSNRVRVTHNHAANFGPFMHPDGKRIIFSSNMHSLDKGGREFDLFIINADGTGLEQVTFTEEFDGFPMFSADGKTLVFCSNRHHANPGETNVFVVDWVD